MPRTAARRRRRNSAGAVLQQGGRRSTSAAAEEDKENLMPGSSLDSGVAAVELGEDAGAIGAELGARSPVAGKDPGHVEEEDSDDDDEDSDDPRDMEERAHADDPQEDGADGAEEYPDPEAELASLGGEEVEFPAAGLGGDTGPDDGDDAADADSADEEKGADDAEDEDGEQEGGDADAGAAGADGAADAAAAGAAAAADGNDKPAAPKKKKKDESMPRKAWKHKTIALATLAAAVFFCFDVETSGPNSRFDHIIQVSMVAYDSAGDALGEFSSYVNVDKPIEYAAYKIHGITSKKLMYKPYWKDVGPKLSAWMDQTMDAFAAAGGIAKSAVTGILAAHNGFATDFRFLFTEMVKNKQTLPDRVSTEQKAGGRRAGATRRAATASVFVRVAAHIFFCLARPFCLGCYQLQRSDCGFPVGIRSHLPTVQTPLY